MCVVCVHGVFAYVYTCTLYACMRGGEGGGERRRREEKAGGRCFQPLFFCIPIDETVNKGYSNCDPDLENATEEEGDERYP